MIVYELLNPKRCLQVRETMKNRGLQCQLHRIAYADGDYHPRVLMEYSNALNKGQCFTDPSGGMLTRVFTELEPDWILEDWETEGPSPNC